MNKTLLLFDTGYDARIGDSLKLYETWLESQFQSRHTRREYFHRVKAFLVFIWESRIDIQSVASNEQIADSTMHRYHRHLQLRMKSISVDAAITAIDSYFRFLGQGKSRILKYRCSTSSRKTLTAAEQQRFVQAFDNCKNTKHRAICALVFYAGIGLNQCASLNYDDIDIAKGTVTVRNSDWIKTQSLPAAAIGPLKAWLDERVEEFANACEPALFLNHSGQRMSRISIYNALRNVGQLAQLEISTRVLQNTISACKLSQPITGAKQEQSQTNKKYASFWNAIPFESASVTIDSVVC